MFKKIFHPYLLSLFPVLFLYGHNMGQGEVRFLDIIAPSIAVLVFAFVTFVFFRAITKDGHKGAVLASLFLLIVLSYGHIYTQMNEFFVVRHRILLPALFAIFILISYFIARAGRDLRQVTVLFNIMAVSFIIVSLSTIGSNAAHFIAQDRKFSAGAHSWVAHTAAPASEMPDIYYIIVDSYAGRSTLRDYYDFDNGPFIDSLEKKGFRVIPESRSNYAWTFLSLSSALNMEYLNHLTKEIGSRNETRILYKMISDSKLQQALRSMGYRILHFGLWQRSGKDETALGFDLGKNKYLSAFALGLIEKSVLNIMYDYYFVSVIKNVTYKTFDAVAKVPDLKEPTFTLAYFYGLHKPYLFNADGKDIDPYTAMEYYKRGAGSGKLYVGQLVFYNRMLLELIDGILSGSDIPPIIVLQSDHGVQCRNCSSGNFRECVQERMRNFNAYYLPGNGNALLYDSITPVNSFRLILKHYFNAPLDLLDDRCYYSELKTPFMLTDITDPGPQ